MDGKQHCEGGDAKPAHKRKCREKWVSEKENYYSEEL
jgi:hypothetical protein